MVRDGGAVRRRRDRVGLRRRDHRLPAGRSRVTRAACSSAAGASRGEDFIDDPDDAPKLLWHESVNPGGMFDVRLLRDVSVICAAGVGGGSLVYANVQLRAPAEVFERDWPAAITRAGLDPWYDMTEAALDPRHHAGRPGAAEAARVRRRWRARRPRRRSGCRSPCTSARTREHPFSGVPPAGLPEPRALRHRLPGARQEHGRHHLPRARREPRRGGAAAAPGDEASSRSRRAAGASPISHLGDGDDGERRGRAARARGRARSARRGCCCRTASRLPGPVARARHALLRQRRRAGDRLRPRRAGRAGRAQRLRAGDDEPARLHRRAAG